MRDLGKYLHIYGLQQGYGVQGYGVRGSKLLQTMSINIFAVDFSIWLANLFLYLVWIKPTILEYHSQAELATNRSSPIHEGDNNSDDDKDFNANRHSIYELLCLCIDVFRPVACLPIYILSISALKQPSTPTNTLMQWNGQNICHQNYEKYLNLPVITLYTLNSFIAYKWEYINEWFMIVDSQLYLIIWSWLLKRLLFIYWCWWWWRWWWC